MDEISVQCPRCGKCLDETTPDENVIHIAGECVVRCILKRDPLFTTRWIVVCAANTKLAWSGSRWVPLFGDVAVSNFDRKEDADKYAQGYGFAVVGNAA
jgi:hypothetical protein